MGEIAERLSAQIKDAIKAGDRTRLQTLRLLSTAVRNREVELRRDLTEEDLVEVATREVKRRKEASEAYQRGGRADRAEQER
ncbi:MAG TPA: GatB/YqeY domain-containing protein, partial [Actinomycetota bacterium]|nr:GatB/YqeY domain-containing protein [Actinomycetota bacterium]